MLWAPKLIWPNFEQDVASVFTEKQFSAGKNGAARRAAHTFSLFFTTTLTVAIFKADESHLF